MKVGLQTVEKGTYVHCTILLVLYTQTFLSSYIPIFTPSPPTTAIIVCSVLALAVLLSSRTYLMPSPSQVLLYGSVCLVFVQLCSWWVWICTAMLLVDADLYSYAPGGRRFVQLCSWWTQICTAMLLVEADLYSYAPGGRRFVQLCSWWTQILSVNSCAGGLGTKPYPSHKLS